VPFRLFVRVDPPKRCLTKLYSVEEYKGLAERCVQEVSRLGLVKSIVLCGSIVKGTVIPGWSDLDLIIFFERLSDEIFIPFGHRAIPSRSII
jgi:predicted nucleotidyltransferase